MPEATCAAEGCERSGQLRRGYCEPHYRRLKRWGDPTAAKAPAKRSCDVSGCLIIGQTRRGLCHVHYHRLLNNGDVGTVHPSRIVGDDETRFWSYVGAGPLPEHRPDLGPCWLWSGYRDPWGYGIMGYQGRSIGAYRVGYELSVGPIPDDLTIDHLCRVTSCVRPTHLEPVTSGENTRRRNLARGSRASDRRDLATVG